MDIPVQCLDYDISTFGSTEQEALANLKEAVELYLEDAPENSHEISEVKVGELIIYWSKEDHAFLVEVLGLTRPPVAALKDIGN